MRILGINAFHADASAAIFVDGKLVAAIEEERFRRVKHWTGFPVKAITFCLQEAGVSLSEIDHICIGRDPRAKFLNKLWYVCSHPSSAGSLVFNRFKNATQVVQLEQEFSAHWGIDPDAIRKKIAYIEHHRSHLASAFFASPFEEAAILSIDGSGDFTTTMLAVGRGTTIEVLDSIDFPQSIGLFYSAFTQYLGFPHYGDEYKVMGLAPYGAPVYEKQIREIIRFKPNGLFGWDASYFASPDKIKIDYSKNIPSISPLFSKKLEALFGPSRKPSDELTQHHKDLASSVQKVCEDLIFHLLVHLKKRTGLSSVCIAGGVAQNSVANGKILERTGFERLYIPSAGHDAGISMGAALYQYNHVLHQPRIAPIYSAFTGVQYSNAEIEAFLRTTGVSYKYMEDDALYDYVTDKLIQPGVVGWFTGRAEFGPRALGGRSILADPRNAAAKGLINEKIKRRESFRPFAPSILREYTGEYFTKVEEVPFMEKVFPIRTEKQAIIPAVTHVDGTGRLQTVMQEVSPRYYALIECFRKKTGVPILLNTSFNENEPIVNSPAEALDCFLRTDMDLLVLENYVVER